MLLYEMCFAKVTNLTNEDIFSFSSFRLLGAKPILWKNYLFIFFIFGFRICLLQKWNTPTTVNKIHDRSLGSHKLLIANAIISSTMVLYLSKTKNFFLSKKKTKTLYNILFSGNYTRKHKIGFPLTFKKEILIIFQ